MLAVQQKIISGQELPNNFNVYNNIGGSSKV